MTEAETAGQRLSFSMFLLFSTSNKELYIDIYREIEAVRVTCYVCIKIDPQIGGNPETRRSSGYFPKPKGKLLKQGKKMVWRSCVAGKVAV